jgi:LmbE family N-acetylglucosaminyl deacetylase
MEQAFVTCGAAFVLAALLIALASSWRRQRYAAAFQVDPRRDDSLHCCANHQVVAISIESDGFELPATLRATRQSAFLSLNVRATITGALVDPFIEVSYGTTTYRQYFERGVSGRRHVNLSPVFRAFCESRGDASAMRVNLRGRSISWSRAGALALFDCPRLESVTSLVLAPHPDDAEIAAFGMYSVTPSWVATVTVGDEGMPDLSALTASGAVATRWGALMRMRDSLTTPQLGNVPLERCVNLVYPDGHLRGMHGLFARPAMLTCEKTISRTSLRAMNRLAEFQSGGAPCTWKGLVDDIRLLLEKANPDIVICPHPLLDSHDDHIFTTVAIEEAARHAKRNDLLFFLYAVHHRHAPLYPFGPACGWVSLPPWTDSEWVADSLYSHPLTPDARIAKYFAVDAAHGLRTYSDGAPRTFKEALRAIRREMGAYGSGIGLSAGSFLRRAPRPNEMYYVVSAQSLTALVKRALVRCHSDRNEC